MYLVFIFWKIFERGKSIEIVIRSYYDLYGKRSHLPIDLSMHLPIQAD